ncbi:MAG: 50S ribosomal protein L11 methyltransferase, partial [Eubacterium sp.]|nr:50S ribosomal protein L11 methyltransferase [Eubacterium sp.]
KPYLKDDGIFITSGISDTREEDVVNAMIENDLEIMDILRMNEWVSIVARKKKNA